MNQNEYCKNKIKVESEKIDNLFQITVNPRIMLPEFSFKRTKQCFWEQFKKNKIEHKLNNDTY